MAVYRFAAECLKVGMSNERVVDELTKRGLSRDTARTVVQKLNEVRRRAKREAAYANMGKGGVICLIGIVVTVATYASAASSPNGGSYVIAWGAILFGGIRFLQGLSQLV